MTNAAPQCGAFCQCYPEPVGLKQPQSVVGSTGPTGATGPIGPTGATGEIGPQGPTGATGPQEPQALQAQRAWPKQFQLEKQ